MAVDSQHPADFGRDFLAEIDQGSRQFVELGAAFGQQLRLPGIEKHLGLEYETIADDADIRAVAENGAQPAEEFRSVARQFLHPLRQRDVQPLPKIGDLVLRFLVTLLRGVERFFERRKLAAESTDLLAQNL